MSCMTRTIFENKYPSLQEVEERLVLEGIIYKNPIVFSSLLERKQSIENDKLYSLKKDLEEDNDYLNFNFDKPHLDKLYEYFRNYQKTEDMSYIYKYNALWEHVLKPHIKLYIRKLKSKGYILKQKIIDDMIENIIFNYDCMFFDIYYFETLEDIRYLFE